MKSVGIKLSWAHVFAFAVFFSFYLNQASAQTASRQYGEIQYPAAGNILTEEGTVEIWYMVRYAEVSRTQSKSYFLYMPFRLESGSLNMLHFLDSEMKACASLSWMRKSYPPIATPNRRLSPITPDKWVHFAYTWKGADTKCYMDGKLSGEARSPLSLPSKDLSEGRIVLGFGDSAITVDRFIVSSRARNDEEISARYKADLIKPDIDTLLQDDFDGVSIVQQQTAATYISGWNGEKGGKLTGNCVQCEGLYGKALACFIDAEPFNESKKLEGK